MIEFVLPQSTGEWLAWIAAAVTVLVGLATMVAPRAMMAGMGFALDLGRPNGLSQLRGPIGGFYVGFGLVGLAFHPQPLIYLALGAALTVSVLGRVVSMLFDGARDGPVLVALLIEAVLALFALSYVFGWVA